MERAETSGGFVIAKNYISGSEMGSEEKSKAILLFFTFQDVCNLLPFKNVLTPDLVAFDASIQEVETGGFL